MFTRPHHQRIALLLQSLDADVLRAHACLFGGGTAIALRYGEFRESVDVDFVVSELAHYRELRLMLTRKDGFSSIVRRDAPALVPVSEVRADQYGIRTRVEVVGAAIKFEVIHEARIALELPGPADGICGVATLTPLERRSGSRAAYKRCRWRRRRRPCGSAFASWRGSCGDPPIARIPISCDKGVMSEALEIFPRRVKVDLNRAL